MHCKGSGAGRGGRRAGQQRVWGQNSWVRVAYAGRRKEKAEGRLLGRDDIYRVDMKCFVLGCSPRDAPVKEFLSTQGKDITGARKDTTPL